MPQAVPHPSRPAAQARCETAFAARPYATSAQSGQASGNAAGGGARAGRRRAAAGASGDSLVAEEEGFSAITDKHIPQRPVSPVEATSYTVVIIAGIAAALTDGERICEEACSCSLLDSGNGQFVPSKQHPGHDAVQLLHALTFGVAAVS